MDEQEVRHECGSLVKDRLTPFTGMVVARCEYLYGRPRCLVCSTIGMSVDGKPVEEWFYEQQLVGA